CFYSFPSVNLEAMAAGKPVVATCFGGSREAVTDGVTGFIVNPYNTATFSDRLLRLLSDPALAQRFGAAGRQRVAKDFSASRWLDMLEQWYKG
ncbi:MAG: glycosyltransferase family 4 protein, partial [Patescibacteria group bacterium]|nr:glycosyltransferase family 4 protein [Patescibacteria group bacterium]